jgi:hypothetical protein
MKALSSKAWRRHAGVFDGIANAATQAVSHWQGQAMRPAPARAKSPTNHGLCRAKHGVDLRFRAKLITPRDATQVIRTQEYMARQMQTLTAQTQELGQSAAK